MAVTGYALSEPRAGAPRRGAVTRMLEDERWLALVLLLPTLVLLGLFICPIRARPIAGICCWPPESVLAW
jgi:hypothetical protein